VWIDFSTLHILVTIGLNLKPPNSSICAKTFNALWWKICGKFEFAQQPKDGVHNQWLVNAYNFCNGWNFHSQKFVCFLSQQIVWTSILLMSSYDNHLHVILNNNFIFGHLHPSITNRLLKKEDLKVDFQMPTIKLHLCAWLFYAWTQLQQRRKMICKGWNKTCLQWSFDIIF
jgi:hypothetical protein